MGRFYRGQPRRVAGQDWRNGRWLHSNMGLARRCGRYRQVSCSRGPRNLDWLELPSGRALAFQPPSTTRAPRLPASPASAAYRERPILDQRPKTWPAPVWLHHPPTPTRSPPCRALRAWRRIRAGLRPSGSRCRLPKGGPVPAKPRGKREAFPLRGASASEALHLLPDPLQ